MQIQLSSGKQRGSFQLWQFDEVLNRDPWDTAGLQEPLKRWQFILHFHVLLLLSH